MVLPTRGWLLQTGDVLRFLTYFWSKELNLNPSAPFSTLELVMLYSLLCSLGCTVVIREEISTF